MAVSSTPSIESKASRAEIDRRIDRIFRRYYRTHSRRLRDQLIQHFLPSVRRHAERLSPRFPVTVQVDKKFVTVPPHTLAWRALADGASVRIQAATALWMEMTR